MSETRCLRCSPERCIGKGTPGSPGGRWEAVAVKYLKRSTHADAECATMKMVQQALEGQSGPHHIVELVEAHPRPGSNYIDLVCK